MSIQGQINGERSAHPVSAAIEREYGIDGWGELGLTKREAFAMAAMQGLSANSAESYAARDMPADIEIQREAQIAVQMADALLAELAKDHP